MQTGYFYKNTWINQSIFASYWGAHHELFCIFEDFYASGMQDAEGNKITVACELKVRVCGKFWWWRAASTSKKNGARTQ